MWKLVSIRNDFISVLLYMRIFKPVNTVVEKQLFIFIFIIIWKEYVSIRIYCVLLLENIFALECIEKTVLKWRETSIAKNQSVFSLHLIFTLYHRSWFNQTKNINKIQQKKSLYFIQDELSFVHKEKETQCNRSLTRTIKTSKHWHFNRYFIEKPQ